MKKIIGAVIKRGLPAIVGERLPKSERKPPTPKPAKIPGY
jgi:hypothetical protein